MQIWKYTLEVERGRRVVMPRGAVPLSFQNQKGLPVLWAMVDPDAPKVEREFSVVGTGHDVPSGVGAFVGTAQFGSLVWHLFDGGEV